MTIEQAISQMEYNRHILGLPYQGDTWRPNANTIACDLALEALREKQERSKGCEYCNDPNTTYGAISFPKTESGKIDISKIEAVEAFFCPMCGKLLKSGAE